MIFLGLEAPGYKNGQKQAKASSDHGESLLQIVALPFAGKEPSKPQATERQKRAKAGLGYSLEIWVFGILNLFRISDFEFRVYFSIWLWGTPDTASGGESFTDG